jgi:hypothetical protein
LLNNRDPPEVKLEEQQKCQDALSSDYRVLSFKQAFQCRKELLFTQQYLADLRVEDVVECQIKHGNESLLNAVLVVLRVLKDHAEPRGGDGFEDDGKQGRIQLANVAQSNSS